MKQCIVDPCILFRRGNNGQLPDITVLQVDDSYGTGSRKFLNDEEEASRQFKTNPRKVLEVGNKCNFNGACITHEARGVYTLMQKEKIGDIVYSDEQKDGVSIRAKIQYIATASRPDLVSFRQLMTAEFSDPNDSTRKKLKSLVKYAKETSDRGLRFVNSGYDSCRIVLFTDSSVSNTADLGS